MVFVESLEVENFKNFHKYAYIGPFLGTNAIVGPNGAGKSNVLDAIAFAFGDTSRNLRVERLQDLIYKSLETNIREDSCFVRVRVTFPGSDKVLTFERQLRKDGREEFLSDGKKLTKKEYLAILEERGIFARLNSFMVRQGSIVGLSENGGQLRTKYIDTVSGAGAMADECKQLELECAESLNQLKEHQELCKAMGKQKQQLLTAQGQRKEIDENMTKLNNVRNEYYLLKMYPIEKKLTSSDQVYEKQKAKIEKKLARPTDDLVELMKQKRLEADQVTKKLEKLGSEKGISEKSEVTATKEFQAAQRLCSHLEEKVAATKEKLHELDTRSQERTDGINALAARISALEEESEELTQRTLNESQSFGNLEAFEEYRSICSRIENDSVCVELEKNVEAISSKEAELTSIQSVCAVEREKIGLKTRELALIEAIDPDAKRQQELQTALDDAEKQLVEFRKVEAEKKVYTAEVAKIQAQLGDQERACDQSKKDVQRAQLNSRFKSLFSGKVFGILKTLCEPVHSDYSLAGAQVLKKWKNAFVVDNEDTATACINYLKENQLARQKFLPVNALCIKSVTPQINSIIESGRGKLMRDCLRPKVDDPSIQTVINYVCGLVVCCGTMDEAAKVSYSNGGSRLTTVAKDGTLFNKNGKLCGGAQSLASQTDIFSDSQFYDLNNRRNELLMLLRKLPKATETVQAIAAKADNLRKTLSQFEGGRDTRLQQRDARRAQTKRILDDFTITLTEKSVLAEKLEKDLTELKAINSKLVKQKEELTRTLFSAFCSKFNVPDVNVFRSVDAQNHEALFERKVLVTKEIEKLSGELVFMRQHTVSDRTHVEEELESCKTELNSAQEKCKKIRLEADRKHETFLQVVTDYQTAENALKTLMEEIAKLKSKVKKQKALQLQLEQLVAERDLLIEEATAELQALFFEVRMKQIQLPLLGANFDDVELFDGDSVNASVLTNAPQVNVIDCRGDYSIISDIVEQASDEAFRTAIDQRAKVIENLEKKIILQESGAMSVTAYNESIVKVRDEEHANLIKLNELTKAHTKNRRTLTAAKQKRSRKFMEAFEHVQTEVDRYYKLLYNSASAQASLILIGTDEPYESRMDYHLVVPGKNRAPVEILSGGEKAMAHLSFLFAAKQAHVDCFLLDEFDEALDKNNLNLVCHFLNSVAKQGVQLMIVSHQLGMYGQALRTLGAYSHCSSECSIGTFLLQLDSRNIQEIEPSTTDTDDERRLFQKLDAGRLPPVDYEDREKIRKEVNIWFQNPEFLKFAEEFKNLNTACDRLSDLTEIEQLQVFHIEEL